jgi:integrase
MAYKTSIRTVLKNVNDKGIGMINLELVFINKDTRKKYRKYINTGQRISKHNISGSKIKQSPETKTLRQLINRKIVEAEETLRNLELDYGEITPEIYDASIKSNKHLRKDIFDLFDMFIAEIAKEHEHLTVKKHNTTKNLLEEYLVFKKKKTLSVNDLNKDLYTDFSKFLKREKKHAPSTVNKYQGSFKRFLKYLHEDLKMVSADFYQDLKKERLDNERVAKIVLLREHVKKINDYQPKNEVLEKVKDMFLFQIYTGVRYSDLKRIDKSFIVDGSISFDMWKVNRRVTIPLHAQAFEIMKKYNFNFSTVCKSMQKYNDDLKVLCENAGLTDEFRTLKIKLNRKVDDDTPIFKLVSSHVARATFITNCLIAGIPAIIVMEYTGHKKIDMLLHYMRVAGNTGKEAFKKFENDFNLSS